MAITGTTALAPQRAFLNDAFAAYNPTGVKFAAATISPAVSSDVEYGQIELITAANYTGTVDSAWARGAYPHKINTILSKVDFFTQRHALVESVDIMDSAAKQYNKAKGAVQKIKFHLQKNLESRVKAVVCNTGTFTGSTLYLDTTITWATGGAFGTCATIIEDINAAKKAIYTNSGMIANTVAMSYNNYMYCLANMGIRGAMGTNLILSNSAVADALPGILGVENIAVSSAGVWGDDYVSVAVTAAPGATEDTPSAFRTVTYSPESSTSVEDVVLESEFDWKADCLDVRGKINTAELLCSSTLAFLLKVS